VNDWFGDEWIGDPVWPHWAWRYWFTLQLASTSHAWLALLDGTERVPEEALDPEWFDRFRVAGWLRW
jgi:hypothetical protein